MVGQGCFVGDSIGNIVVPDIDFWARIMGYYNVLDVVDSYTCEKFHMLWFFFEQWEILRDRKYTYFSWTIPGE
jgi:hypothetical protein